MNDALSEFVAILIALGAASAGVQEPQIQYPAYIFADARTGCEYRVSGSPNGLQVSASRHDCIVTVRRPQEETQ